MQRREVKPYHDLDSSRNSLGPKLSSFSLCENLRDTVSLNHSNPLILILIRHNILLLPLNTINQNRASEFPALISTVRPNRFCVVG